VRFFVYHCFCVLLAIAPTMVAAGPPGDEDAMIAESLAEMLRDARTVVSNVAT
jgi:hypothetical protein